MKAKVIYSSPFSTFAFAKCEDGTEAIVGHRSLVGGTKMSQLAFGTKLDILELRKAEGPRRQAYGVTLDAPLYQ